MSFPLPAGCGGLGGRGSAMPNAQPSTAVVHDETEELVLHLSKLLVAPKNHHQLAGKEGFDFSTGCLPYVWWQYSHPGALHQG